MKSQGLTISTVDFYSDSKKAQNFTGRMRRITVSVTQSNPTDNSLIIYRDAGCLLLRPTYTILPRNVNILNVHIMLVIACSRSYAQKMIELVPTLIQSDTHSETDFSTLPIRA